MVYLDYAATTPLNKEVFETYTKVLTKYFGNPDSIHKLGSEVSRLVEDARNNIKEQLGLTNHQIIFTSGASEANNMALKGIAFANIVKGKHIITTNIEHASIMNTCEQLERLFDFKITYLPVNKDGVVTLKQVKAAITKDTILVSIMDVNNEIGSMNPISEIGEYLKQAKILFHVDLVQGVGKHALDLKNIDLGTISAHKIHGLKGSGILFIRKGLNFEPLINGGGQEFGMRGGTNNAPVNIVLAKTLRLALSSQKDNYERIVKINTLMREKLKEVSFNSPINGSPYILNFSTPIGSEIMMNALQKADFLVSSRSTCASKYTVASHVLLAIGISEEVANKSIRVSLQDEVSEEDILHFIKVTNEIIVKYK